MHGFNDGDIVEVIPNNIFHGNAQVGDRARVDYSILRAGTTIDAYEYLPVVWLGDINQNAGGYPPFIFKRVATNNCGNCDTQVEYNQVDYLCADCRAKQI